MGKETIRDVVEQLVLLNTSVATMDTKVTSNGTKLEGVKGEVRKLSEAVAELGPRVQLIEEKCAAVEKRCDELNLSVADARTYALKEIHKIEAKRNNLVLFGIPEASDSHQGSPRDQDLKKVDEVVELLAGAKKPFELKFRIGKKQDRPRPILVRMRDLIDKDSLLSKAHTLSQHPQWKKTFIQPDLTRNQREQVQRMESELTITAATRNAELKNGEGWKWAIRGRGMDRHLAKVKVARA